MKRNVIRLSTVVILTALAAWIWSERAQAQRRARNGPNQPIDYRLQTTDQPRPAQLGRPPVRPTQLARPPVVANNQTVPAQPTYRLPANQTTQSNWATNSAYREPPNPQQIKISNLRSEILFRAEDDKQREEKLTELQTLLEESFDKGIKAQGDELAELEKRVAELKKTFERRKTNRDRVIANYVDSVRLQAEGLTIPALGNGNQVPAPYHSPPPSNRPQRTGIRNQRNQNSYIPAAQGALGHPIDASAAAEDWRPRTRSNRQPLVEPALTSEPTNEELPADLPDDEGELDDLNDSDSVGIIDGGPDVAPSFDADIDDFGEDVPDLIE